MLIVPFLNGTFDTNNCTSEVGAIQPDECGPTPHEMIQGLGGDIGCSGDPNPPTDMDIWKYNHGEFTSRQDDIRIGSCYSPSNMATMNADNATIIITQANGTQIELTVFKNGTVEAVR